MVSTFAGKVAVRDSFDEDVSDDVDDEVFIRDGRNGFKLDEERGVKRPLMPPRRRAKTPKVPMNSYSSSSHTCRSFLSPCCYGVLALVVLLGLFALAVIVFKFLPIKIDQFRFWKSQSFGQSSKKAILSCSNIIVNDVWTKSFPKLTSESAVRLSDVNNDKVLDIIMGYGTGADGRNVPDFVCTLYFKRDPPCLGGIVALNGRNGEVLWQHWTQRPVLSIDCAADLTEDKVCDCLIGGKGGLLHAVNGHDGSLLWHLEDNLQQQQVEPLLDIYSAQYIADIDGDNFVDVVAAHTYSDNTDAVVKGHLLLVSGKTGRLLRMIEMPGVSESYYAPQLLVDPDGEKKVLFGTGGTSGHLQGGIYTIPLSDLSATKKLLSNAVVTSDALGTLAPPVLVDINGDGVEDIIASFFNATVIAIDGHTFSPLWNYSFPNSQSLSAPTPGYFNADDVPDFLVKYQSGPGYPHYYYSQVNILDGKTGSPLLDHHIVDSVGSQMGGLSVSMEGTGSDWFLFWTADCVGFEGTQTPFTYTKGSSLVAQSHADVCRLRFNTSMSATLWALNQQIEPPGIAVYSSGARKMLEYNRSQTFLDEANKYLASHPDFRSVYDSQMKISTRMGASSNQGRISQDGSDSWSNGSPDSASEQLSQSYVSDGFNRMSNSGASTGRVINEGGTGEEEQEEPEFSRLQLPHMGKPHRPVMWTPEQTNWNMNVGAGGFRNNLHTKQFLNSHGSGTTNHDYDSQISDVGEESRMSNDYSGLLTDPTNSNSDARETASNFLQAIHDETVQGDKQIKRSNIEKITKSSTPGLKAWKTRHLNLADFIKQTKENKEEIMIKNTSEIPRGIHPITSTGTLAPPLSGSGIDLIINTYWIPPSDEIQILSPNDVQCIQDGIARASSDVKGKFSGMDEETLELAVTAECLLYRFSSSSSLSSGVSRDAYLEPHPSFIPLFFAESEFENINSNYLNLRFGQLTVYRLNIQCQCKNVQSIPGTCANILPFEKQSWPSFMGHDGKGYFRPRF